MSEKYQDSDVTLEMLKLLETKAETISSTYSFRITPLEDGRFMAVGIELPLVLVSAQENDVIAKMRTALHDAVTSLLVASEIPPSALREVRNEVLNIRVSATEKISMELRSRRFGFKNLSDFVRSVSTGTE